MPDFIEDNVIDIKNIIMENGFKEGISQVIDSVVNVGKSAMGIVTGNFENIGQVKIAVEKGGILDKTSSLIDFAVNKASKNKLISNNVAKLIKQGKNILLDSVTSNIEKTLEKQEKAIENLDKHCEIWLKSFDERNFNKMEKSFEKIEENIEYVIPIEKTISKAREIENIHNLIKSKNGNLDISQEELNLAKLLK